MPGDSARSYAIGVAAALCTVVTTVGWTLATRSGVTTTLTPLDLALLRYCVPALILAPIWLRHGLVPAQGSVWLTLIMVLGGGLPFALVAMAGAQFAPAAHMGALLQGTMPLMAALLASVLLGERLSPPRLLGFGLIVAGDVAIAAPALAQAHEGAWRGDVLFLLAGLLWATYTVAFRKSGQSALHMAAAISFWSGLLALPMWWLAGAGRLLTAPPSDIAVQVLWQGLMAGTVAVAAYGVAIRRLGASNAALAGALVPPGAAIGGLLVLDEAFDVPTALGIAVISAGVLFASGAIRPRRSSEP